MTAPAARPRWADLLSTGVVAVGVLAAVAALGGVLAGASWFVGATSVVVVVLAAGALARSTRWPGAAFVAEVIAWVLAVTATQLSASAILGVVPHADTVEASVALIGEAVVEIATGTVPLAVSPGPSLVIVAGAGLLAIVADQLAVSARAPLFAAPALLAVVLVPALAAAGPSGDGSGFGATEAAAFVAVAATVLALCAIETSTRVRVAEPARQRARRALVTVVAGAVVVSTAVIAAPVLPRIGAPLDLGGGISGTSISATLDLGDDLRMPSRVEVLRVRTATPGYLRALTITELGADGWRADEPSTTAPLDGIPPLARAGGVSYSDDVADIEVTGLTARRLPVPFAVTEMSGADGYRLVLDDRTVVGRPASPGIRYRTTASVARPTVEQLRAASADDAPDPRTTDVPAETPEVIAAEARRVTATASSDYDRLLALQDWFRGADFRYSLTAPSRLGYDDGGLAATAQFLESREGYCVHFASAFTLMARSLGMPARIVVGYLPGDPVAAPGEVTFSVTNQELHAWPEVHFAGIGWTAFEPTNSLGSPASLLPLPSPAPGETPGAATPSPTPNAPTPGATFTLPPAPPADASPENPGEAPSEAPATGAVAGALAALLALVVAVAAAPALLRIGRDRSALRRAARGDVGAAWAVVRRRAVDLGLGLEPGDSPRQIGRRLVHAGAPPAVVSSLVAAVERAAFGRPTAAPVPAGIADDARGIRRALTARAPLPRRVAAILAPRSTFTRASERPRRTG